jgi:hypothetical protein
MKQTARLAMMIIVSLIVVASGILFSANSFSNREAESGILAGIIAITILGFLIFVFIRGSRDLKEGYPIKDERSAKVLEKASSKAFYVSLYVLLALGFLSDGIINFRDVSQATSAAVGLMALLFLIFWLYYNQKAM